MKRIAFLVFLLAGALVQRGAAQPSSGGPTPGAATTTPIDGGASLLLAGGAAYAVRKLRARRAGR